jgi:hypothetical protein
MLWDNIRCTTQGTFLINFAYNPNVTNKVTVSKTESAAYSDGVSSTINSTNDKVGTTISGGGGVNNRADAFVEIRQRKSRVDISASLYYRRNQYTHI